MNAIDLAGRVAVVTGGAGGIGGAIVDRLLRSGAQVAVWDLQSSSLSHDDLIAIDADVTRRPAVDAALRRTLDRFGRIDILVNAAGATGPTLPVETYPEDAWRAVIELNLNSVFLTCQAVVEGMKARDYGRILNISSIAGKEGNPNLAAYSAAKAGVIAFTKVLARELAETGVRANVVTPGLFRTRILDAMSSEAVEWSLSRIPMKRAGRLEEIGALAAWLVSEECSFSTGAVFDISGGRASY